MDWQPDQPTLDLIRHLALQNSYQYAGKGQAGSVISRIMGSRADLRQYGKFIAPLVGKEVAKANAMAQDEGLDAVREILENEAPELLEKNPNSKRRIARTTQSKQQKAGVKICTQPKRTTVVRSFKGFGHQWPICKGIGR